MWLNCEGSGDAGQRQCLTEVVLVVHLHHVQDEVPGRVVPDVRRDVAWGTASKGSVLAARAVEAQGKGTVLAAKAVETQGKGGVAPSLIRPELEVAFGSRWLSRNFGCTRASVFLPPEPGGSACCHWSGCGSSATTRLIGLTMRSRRPGL